MGPRTVRSRLVTATMLVLVILGWVYLAPTRIGGSTTYVITHGTSMEPQFHTGDLALVRPLDQYKVGEIVAYHSTALHEIVLHRIHARDGDRFVFKGDNNNFTDPTYPTRSLLIGALWLHIPRGGPVLALLDTPLVAGGVTAVVAVLLLFGAEEKRRRRNHRRNGATGSGRQGPPPVKNLDHGASRHINFDALLIACAVAVTAFLGLGLIAFNRPLHRPTMVNVPYTQGISVGYAARARPGLVYPSGVLRTGDPIFLALVSRVGVRIDYRLATGAAHRVTGTEGVALRLTGPGGWSRSIQIAAPKRFTGDYATRQVTLDVTYMQSLVSRIATLSGVGGGFTIALVPQVQISGTLAGHPITTGFAPTLNLQLGPGQLIIGGATAASGAAQSGLTPSKSGSVATASSVSNTLSIDGHALSIATLRWITLAGWLLAAASACLVTTRMKLSEPFGETASIEAEYGHLMVPIVGGVDEMWTPFDVPSIKALARLAECSERLILHQHDDAGDTYLLDDEGTIYRYRAEPKGVVWGDWSSPPPDASANGRGGPDGSTASPPPEPADLADAEPDLPVQEAPLEPHPSEPDAPLPPDAGVHSLPGYDAKRPAAVRANVGSIVALRARMGKAVRSRRAPPPGGSPTVIGPRDTAPSSAEDGPEAARPVTPLPGEIRPA